MTLKTNVTQIDPEGRVLDYPGALIILRGKRERRFRNMVSGVIAYEEEYQTLADL